MRTLSGAEFAQWCSDHGFESVSREWPTYRAADRHSFLIKLPEKASRVIALGRTCVYLAEQSTFRGALVWFRDWSIWNQTDEETGMRIIERLRSALGAALPLMDAPGHVFSADEFTDARAFWTVPMVFGWDVILFPEGNDFFVFNSHDEVVAFVSRSRETHLRLLRDLKHWEPIEDGWYFR